MVLIVFLLSIVAQRVARIRSLFDCGHEVEASLLKVKRCRRGTTLTLEDERNGTLYKVRFAFSRTLESPEFKEGTRISLLVDPAHPKRVIPLALYGDPSTVITSYSIHYTKLYDITARRRRICFGFLARS